MRVLLSVLFVASVACLPEAPGADSEWTSLMKPEVWRRYDAAWIPADEVMLDGEKKNKLKATKKAEGAAWVNGEKGRLPDLLTKQSYGDCEVHVEFLIAKGSNAGIKFHALYEIQILDSFGSKKELSGDSMGGIYPRADDKMGYKHIDKGIAPKVNAAKAPGAWQTLDVTWKSPRFDDKGEKTSNAMIVKATLNGQVIHENQELKTPTGANWVRKETATGPFMLQADHGPVAFRNVKIRPVK
jgi:hypothetical protein